MKGISLERSILQYTTTYAAKDQLNTQIYPRRYFYPSLRKLPNLKEEHPYLVEDISRRAMCLLLSLGLQEGEVKDLSNVILDTLR